MISAWFKHRKATLYIHELIPLRSQLSLMIMALFHRIVIPPVQLIPVKLDSRLSWIRVKLFVIVTFIRVVFVDVTLLC